MARNNLIALEPKKIPTYASAIESAGASVVELSADVEALVWTDYSRPDLLKQTLARNPQLRWVQLPFAGVDAFADLLAHEVIFTSAKRSYSEPVAEHALMLSMALGRVLKMRTHAKTWGEKHVDSLYDNQVLIVGGGGISEELVRLLEAFRCKVVVVRKRPEQPFEHSSFSSCVGFEELETQLAKAQFVVLACALTNETRLLFDRKKFALMRSDAYLVNVARGEIIDQDALEKALDDGEIAGAAIDVTYPEPLPDEHRLWGVDNLIITPHTADTMEIVAELFVTRLQENVLRWLSAEELVGVVDPKLGY